jgi:CheY-like chemotaxis protein
MKIFILEDNESRVRLFRTWYEGHYLTTTANAVEAIAILKSKLVSLGVRGVQML